MTPGMKASTGWTRSEFLFIASTFLWIEWDDTAAVLATAMAGMASCVMSALRCDTLR